jgi:hypothetical protein
MRQEENRRQVASESSFQLNCHSQLVSVSGDIGSKSKNTYSYPTTQKAASVISVLSALIQNQPRALIT